jgi:predicted RNase H-like HicB family nuclease
MTLEYTYWKEDDGWFLGYLNDYPEHWTQGKTVEELEEMLCDLYEIEQEENVRTIPERKIGKLAIA